MDLVDLTDSSDLLDSLDLVDLSFDLVVFQFIIHLKPMHFSVASNILLLIFGAYIYA